MGRTQVEERPTHARVVPCFVARCVRCCVLRCCVGGRASRCSVVRVAVVACVVLFVWCWVATLQLPLLVSLVLAWPCFVGHDSRPTFHAPHYPSRHHQAPAQGWHSVGQALMGHGTEVGFVLDHYIVRHKYNTGFGQAVQYVQTMARVGRGTWTAGRAPLWPLEVIF